MNYAWLYERLNPYTATTMERTEHIKHNATLSPHMIWINTKRVTLGKLHTLMIWAKGEVFEKGEILACAIFVNFSIIDQRIRGTKPQPCQVYANSLGSSLE